MLRTISNVDDVLTDDVAALMNLEMGGLNTSRLFRLLGVEVSSNRDWNLKAAWAVAEEAAQTTINIACACISERLRKIKRKSRGGEQS